MSVKLLTEHHLEFPRLKGGCIGLFESTLAKMLHCWKSHVWAHMLIFVFIWFHSVCCLCAFHFPTLIIQDITSVMSEFSRCTSKRRLISSCTLKIGRSEWTNAYLIEKQVSMNRKYHNHTLQINPRHREEEPQNTNSHKTIEVSNPLSLSHQDGCKTRKNTK